MIRYYLNQICRGNTGGNFVLKTDIHIFEQLVQLDEYNSLQYLWKISTSCTSFPRSMFCKILSTIATAFASPMLHSALLRSEMLTFVEVKFNRR